MKTKKTIIGLVLVAGLFFSCNSNDILADKTPLTADDIKNEAYIDAAIEDIAAIAEDQYASEQASPTAKSNVQIKGNLPSCATVTTVFTTNSYTRTVDFGIDGCALANGNSIKGKIIFTFSKDFTLATRTISYKFENFYHNGRLITGDRAIELTKKTTENLNVVHPVSTLTIDMSVTFDNGKKYTRKGTRVRELIEGFATPLILSDNVFIITGTQTTTNSIGSTIISTIGTQTPLRFKASCGFPYPVSGSVTITKNDSVGVIDFGSGDCDKLATFSLNGSTPFPITL